MRLAVALVLIVPLAGCIQTTGIETAAASFGALPAGSSITVRNETYVLHEAVERLDAYGVLRPLVEARRESGLSVWLEPMSRAFVLETEGENLGGPLRFGCWSDGLFELPFLLPGRTWAVGDVHPATIEGDALNATRVATDPFTLRLTGDDAVADVTYDFDGKPSLASLRTITLDFPHVDLGCDVQNGTHEVALSPGTGAPIPWGDEHLHTPFDPASASWPMPGTGDTGTLVDLEAVVERLELDPVYLAFVEGGEVWPHSMSMTASPYATGTGTAWWSIILVREDGQSLSILAEGVGVAGEGAVLQVWLRQDARHGPLEPPGDVVSLAELVAVVRALHARDGEMLVGMEWRESVDHLLLAYGEGESTRYCFSDAARGNIQRCQVGLPTCREGFTPSLPAPGILRTASECPLPSTWVRATGP